ncbi:hypothetical protein BDF14DRAFT_1849316 [Spinellus fusiger]|nr:hypothetical protein BDF14DRAFT_1849316 [Spinellus fusiger]
MIPSVMIRTSDYSLVIILSLCLVLKMMLICIVCSIESYLTNLDKWLFCLILCKYDVLILTKKLPRKYMLFTHVNGCIFIYIYIRGDKYTLFH